MHEHTRHRLARRAPETPGEPDAARVGLDLEPSRKAVRASRHFEDGSEELS
jgi:hypothetical protein